MLDDINFVKIKIQNPKTLQMKPKIKFTTFGEVFLIIFIMKMPTKEQPYHVFHPHMNHEFGIYIFKYSYVYCYTNCYT